ncbi:MAG: hypothetical protein J6Y37_04470 [Paludibacteraceae bacterium]|nr:hypothetical protein [Paludibacteraceae bacterium]
MKKITKKLIFAILYTTSISFFFMTEVMVRMFQHFVPNYDYDLPIETWIQFFIYCLLISSVLYIVFFSVRKKKSSLIARITAWLGLIFILTPYPFIFNYVSVFGGSLVFLFTLMLLDGLYYLLAKKLVDEKREVGESNENLQL